MEQAALTELRGLVRAGRIGELLRRTEGVQDPGALALRAEGQALRGEPHELPASLAERGTAFEASLVHTVRARLALMGGRPTAALASLDRAARGLDDPDLSAWVATLRCAAFQWLGDAAAAEAVVAHVGGMPTGATCGELDSRISFADVLRNRGDLDGAALAYGQVRDAAHDRGWVLLEQGALRGLGSLAMLRGDADEHLRISQARVQRLTDTDLDVAMGVALFDVGSAYETRGDLDLAIEAYRSGLAHVLPGMAVYGFVALARALALAGSLDEARAALARAETSQGLPAAQAAVIRLLLETDPSRWDRARVSAQLRLTASGHRSPDVARVARAAATQWEARGDRGRAAHALALAWDHAPNDGLGEGIARLVSQGGPIPLGPMLLHRPIGRGAAGEVWDATLGAGGPVAAVKVIVNARHAHQALQNELNAVASLEHPGIVPLLATGWVDGAAAAANPALVEGSPWLAMERIDGGTLLDVCGEMPWVECRRVLLGVLDALAYAHARGRLHLDLKPENVLLRRDGSPVLADFGISALVGERRRAAGTPSFMAPEQFHGSRDMGPATDLYALGGLAWALLTGQPPFRATSVSEWAHAQAAWTVAPLQAGADVPAGVDRWLRRMLGKRPRHRFQTAADAAGALRSVEKRGPVVLAPPRPRPFVAPPAPPACTLDPQTALQVMPLRRLPMVGRVAERRALWTSLSSTVAGRAQAVSISGPLGSGAGRLARWLCLEAAEQGVAATYAVDCGAGISPVGQLVRAILRCDGLSGAALQSRVQRLARNLEWDVDASVATELIQGVGLDDGTASRLVCGLLAAVAAQRPVVVHEDGAADGPGLLPFLEPLLGSPCPLLVVRTGARGADGGLDLELDPVDDPSLAIAVAARLPLDPAALDTVVAMADGMPAHAWRLLLHLVAKDALEPGPRGLRLRPQAKGLAGGIVVPVGLELLEPLSPAARTAVVGASLLGRVVEDRRLVRLCQATGGQLRAEASEVLRKVARRHRGAWVFHSEAVRALLAEHADAPLWHAALRLDPPPEIAAKLHLHLGDWDAAFELLVRAMLSASARGQWRRARALLTAAGESLDRFDVPLDHPHRDRVTVLRARITVVWIRDGDAALAIIQPLEDTRPSCATAETMARIATFQRRPEEALRWLELARTRSTTHEERVRIAQVLGTCLSRQGRHLEAIEVLRVVVRLAAPRSQPWVTALMGLGVALARCGQLDEARVHLQAVVDGYETLGEMHARTTSLVNLGEAARLGGDAAFAEECFTEAVASYRAMAHPLAWGAACHLLGTLLEQCRPAEAVERSSAWLRELPDASGPQTQSMQDTVRLVAATDAPFDRWHEAMVAMRGVTEASLGVLRQLVPHLEDPRRRIAVVDWVRRVEAEPDMPWSRSAPVKEGRREPSTPGD